MKGKRRIMKTITKITWREEAGPFWGHGSTEKMSLTLSRDTIQFEGSAQVDDPYDEGPISEAHEKWKVKIKAPDYQQAFDAIAQYADDIVNGRKEYGIICDGPTQSLIVYYGDGTKKRLINKYTCLMSKAVLTMNLKAFLPDRMIGAIVDDPEEEGE